MSAVSLLRTRVEHSVNSRAQAVPFRDSAPAGLRAVADALSLPDAPILMTSSECKSGMSFLELNCKRHNLGVTMSGNITLRDLSSACDLSIRHFTRAFRKSTGMAPHAWLLHHNREGKRTAGELSPRTG